MFLLIDDEKGVIDLKTIRRRAVIKALGENYGIKMRYKRLNDKKKPKAYVITNNNPALDTHIVSDNIRVLRWSNLFPYLKEVLKGHYSRSF